MAQYPIAAGAIYPDPGGLPAAGITCTGARGETLTWSGSSWQSLSAAQAAGAASMVSGAGKPPPWGTDMSWLLPTHLPILSPERHRAMAPITVGGVTVSYQPGGERGLGMIRVETTAATGPTTIRLPLPASAEYSGKKLKSSARMHYRHRASDWSKIQRLYLGPGTQAGGAYYFHKIAESNQTRCGATDPTYASAWNNKWRTIIESSDKKYVGAGTPDAWGSNNRYLDGIDGLYITLTTTGAVTIDFDRVYSPDWPIGFVVNIFDGSYGSARDIALPDFAKRGWRLGMSGNRVDGSVGGVTRYPTLADLAAVAAAGHDVFLHGHYLSGTTPVPMTSSVTEAEALEILTAARAAIAGAVGGVGSRGMRWHQWLTNVGAYAGTDMASLLKSMGVQAARGYCSDAEYGIDPTISGGKTSLWALAPEPETKVEMCGYVSHMGRFNRTVTNFTAATTNSALGRDTYADSGVQRALAYAANNADGFITYTHNLLPYDGVNPTSPDTGTNYWRDYLADLDAKVAAGKIIVLSPTDLERLTYWREGDVYVRWDGEWRNRGDDSIAF